MIEDPLKTLRQLKEKNAHLQQDVWLADLKRFATEFEKAHGFNLEFKPMAADALIAEGTETDRTINPSAKRNLKISNTWPLDHQSKHWTDRIQNWTTSC